MPFSEAPLRRPARLLPLVTAVTLAAFTALPGGAVLGVSTADAQSSKKQPAKKNAKKKPKYTLEGELRKLQSSKAISSRDFRDWRTLYRGTVDDARKLPKGLRRTELEAVIRNTEQIAERRKLTGSLAPSVFLTLSTNRTWWKTQPIPPVGGRPVVADSPLTWQYYRGEGLQIQWLATFGTANALATTKTPAKLEQLRAIQTEALRLASDRAGGPTWAYLFDFGGGAPPWSSGMAQVTGIQSLVRTSAKLGDPSFQETGLKAMALLRREPTSGARLKMPAGDHILLYTYTRMRVMNAFAQAVSGLHEIARLTQDPQAHSAYLRAESQLRVELPEYVTANWATYSIGGAPETPSYHTLSRDLLRGLCRSLTADAELFITGQPVAGLQAPADPTIYCQTAERFTLDLQRTPNGPGRSNARATSRAATPTGRSAVPADDPAATLGDPALLRP
ncbi:MAG: D-glucuronyl C5-epimerase family protein [Patulibacter sp.]